MVNRSTNLTVKIPLKLKVHSDWLNVYQLISHMAIQKKKHLSHCSWSQRIYTTASTVVVSPALLPCYFPFNWTYNAKVNQPTKINWLLVRKTLLLASLPFVHFIHPSIGLLFQIMVVYVGELVPPTVSVTDLTLTKQLWDLVWLVVSFECHVSVSATPYFCDTNFYYEGNWHFNGILW